MSGLLPCKDMLDGDPLPSYENIEEAEPLRIEETTDGWVPLVEHLGGKHNQKSHGRHHSTAARATFRDGGYTVSYVGRKPRSGYMVGGVEIPTGKYRRNVSSTKVIKGANEATARTAIKDYVAEHRATLKQPGHYLGTWRDGDDLYLDISQRMPTRAKALILGRERNELAVYDVKSGVSIDIPKHSSWGPETQEWDDTPLR